MFDIKKVNLCDVFNFSMVWKRFYYISRANKKFTSAVTFSKRILNLETDYFDFLKSELWCLGREIRKKFEERIVRHTFVFSLIDIHLEKIAYDFFVWEASGTLESVMFVVDFWLTIQILPQK